MSCFVKPIHDHDGTYRGCQISQGPTLDELDTRMFTAKQVPEGACMSYCPREEAAQAATDTHIKPSNRINTPNGTAEPLPPVHKHMFIEAIAQYTVHVATGLCELHNAMSSKGLDNFTVQPEVEGRGDFFATLTDAGVEALINTRPVIPLLIVEWHVYRPSALWLCSDQIKPILKLDRPMEDACALLPSLSDAAMTAISKPMTAGNKWIMWYKEATNQYAVSDELIRAKAMMESELANVVHPNGQPLLRELAAETHQRYTPTSPSLAELINRVGIANCETAAIAAAHKLGGEGTLIATGSIVKDGYVDFTASNHAWNIIHNSDNAGSLASLDFTPPSLTNFVKKKFQNNWFVSDEVISKNVDNALIRIALGIVDGKRADALLDEPSHDDVNRLVEGVISGRWVKLYAFIDDDKYMNQSWTDRKRIIAAFDANPAGELAERVARMRVLEDAASVHKALTHKDLALLTQLYDRGVDMSAPHGVLQTLMDDQEFGQQCINRFHMDVHRMFIEDHNVRHEGIYYGAHIESKIKFLKINGVFDHPNVKMEVLNGFKRMLVNKELDSKRRASYEACVRMMQG